MGRLRIESDIDDATESLASNAIGAAIQVHRTLGPDFTESIYEIALCIELTKQEVPFARQHRERIQYDGHDVGEGRVGLLVDDRVVVELKAVEFRNTNHEEQVHSYLKATNLRLGLLVNFNVALSKGGLRRIVH